MWQGPAALRDFNPVNVGSGSIASRSDPGRSWADFRNTPKADTQHWLAGRRSGVPPTPSRDRSAGKCVPIWTAMQTLCRAPSSGAKQPSMNVATSIREPDMTPRIPQNFSTWLLDWSLVTVLSDTPPRDPNDDDD